jgi:hypothetical protein
LRCAELGHHHHIAGTYLLRYAQEASWREDNRKVSNGEQVKRLAGLAMSKKESPDFTGYWQRHINRGCVRKRTKFVLEPSRQNGQASPCDVG